MGNREIGQLGKIKKMQKIERTGKQNIETSGEIEKQGKQKIGNREWGNREIEEIQKQGNREVT